jgi:hypothetical protein
MKEVKVIQVRAVAQAFSRQPPTSEAQFRVRDSTCGICGRQRGTVTDISPNSSVVPCQYHTTSALHIRVIWRMNNSPVGGCSSER